MNRLFGVAPFVFLLLTAGVAQSGIPECSGSDLHLALATIGTQTVSTSIGTGVMMFGLSNPATCVTQGVAYIVSATDTSTADSYGWALVCVSVPNCPAGKIVAQTLTVPGTVFSPTASHSAFLPWTLAATITPGIYGLAIGTTCSAGCVVLYGDALYGSWYPFVQGGTTTPGVFNWSFSPGGFSFNGELPSTSNPPILGTAAGISPPAAILY